MKNKALNLPYKLLIILSIFAILPACSISDDDEDELSNSAPSVSAGEDQTVNQGATVNLTGVASDSDGSISSWLWQQTSGSPSVTIKNSTTSNASFTAPEVDAETTLVFELEVKDNDGASVSDSMRVTVRGPGDSVNPLPSDFKAEAGDGQVTLTWTHHSDTNTDYNIYRSSASDCELANYTTCANSALFTSKSSGFTDDTGLTNGTNYYYWIEAILNGVTYLDGDFISATPRVDDDIDLTDGLVAHYEFENNADDSSGNGNDGEEFGGVSYTDGVIGKALKITSEGDRIEISHTSSIDLTNNQHGFSVFFKAGNLYSTYSQIFDKTAGSDYALNIEDDNGEFYLRVSLGDGNELTEILRHEIELDEYYHFVLLKNGDTFYFYLDNTMIGTSEYSGLQANTNPLIVGSGGSPYVSGYGFNGIIDDLRFYNRILNTAEIQALYELGNIDLSDGLVAHYEFEGNADDSSGNDNDGEEFGGVAYSHGVIGNALKITNEGDRVEISNSELTRLDSNNKTISVFFEAQDLFAEYNQILDKTAGSDYALNVTRDGLLRLSVHNSLDYEVITTEIEVFRIYHAVILRSGSSVALYLDGNLISEINIPDIKTTNNPLLVGAGGTPYDSGYSFNGIIDDLRIYNRALSTAEIQTLYELGDN